MSSIVRDAPGFKDAESLTNEKANEDGDVAALTASLGCLCLAAVHSSPDERRQNIDDSPPARFTYTLPVPLGPTGPPRDCAEEPEICEVWYVVWVAPNWPALAGVHRGRLAWKGIVERLPNQRYDYRDGTRLRGWAPMPGGRRRRYTYLEALRAYFAERARHGSPKQCNIFVWDKDGQR